MGKEIIDEKKKHSLPKIFTLRKFVLIFIFLLMTAAFYCLRFYHPTGEGEAGPEIGAAPFENVWTDRSVVLLGYGDSITAGFGVREQYNYVARLANNPQDEFESMKGRALCRVFPDLKVINCAVSGSTSLYHRQYLDKKIQTFGAEEFGIIVLTTGGNDLIHNYGQTPPKEGAMYGATLQQARPWINQFEKRLDEIIEGLTAKFPGGCLIFLADIYDPSDGVGDAPSVFLPAWPDCLLILDQYNQIIQKCAQKHSHVFHVPIHDAFLGHGIHCSDFWRSHYCRKDPTYWYGENLEDPNIRGFDVVRRLFLRAIIQQKTFFNKLKNSPNDSESPDLKSKKNNSQNGCK